MKPDIIVCWPRNNDYPLWREFIRNNRARFNEIIIVFTETNFGDDFRDFVRTAMFNDAVQFVDILPIPAGEDWRSVSINAALLHSYNAEWIWFTEQDFFPGEDYFDWWNAYAGMGCTVIAAYDGERMHPCSILVKRETLVNKTRRNFGIVPDVSDHFSRIQKELEENCVAIGKIPPRTYEHLNGLSHNFSLLTRGEKPNWNVERFNTYLSDCLLVSGVPLCDRWVLQVGDYLASIREKSV